jgi:Chitobiase/beta-hexosaminidase C-terminal domain
MVIVGASVAQAQDPAAEAAQQANQQARQATQQAMQANQQAMQQMQAAQQQAAQDAQNAAQNIPTNTSAPYWAVKPKFSAKPGTYAKPTTVKITDSTRGAIIYYTTDGWTPTVMSNRYIGPITVNSTTTLQAIAIVPYRGRSLVASAEYIISGTSNSLVAPQSPGPSASLAAAGGAPSGLLEGTAVEFIFAGDVSSKNASVGDTVPVTLASDLMAGGMVVAKKGTLGSVTIIQVDKTSAGGLPGDLVFQADALNVNGRVIPLRGSEEREGEAKPPNATTLIPVVGPFTIFKHGKDAEISRGTPFTAYVDQNTSLASLQ